MALKLDRTLYDTYRQYKAEEKNLIDWFVRTSQKCSGTEFFNNGKRSTTDIENTPIYDILPVIRAIAMHPSVERVPNDIATSLRSVTLKQARCSAWYKSNTKLGDSEAQRLNRTHEYPLYVLRKTAELLKRKLPSQSPTSHVKCEKPKTKSDSHLLVNSFANLDIEDCVEVSSSQETVDVPQDKECESSMISSLVLPKKTPDSQINEIMMLRYCFLEDMETLEAVVIQEWMSYLTGSQTLLGACTITNHAVSLVMKLECDAYESISSDDLELGEHDPFTYISSFDLCGSSKSDSLTPSNISPSDQEPAKPAVFRMQHILSDLWSHPDKFEESLNLYTDIEAVDYFGTGTDEQTQYGSATVAVITDKCMSDIKSKCCFNPKTPFIRLLGWLESHPDIWNTPDRIPLSVAFASRLEVLAHIFVVAKLKRRDRS